MDSNATSSIVRLNIGGYEYLTTVGTLTHREPQSMLAAMFSGHAVYKDPEKGYVFIDRDGKHFGHVLNWLRDGVAPIPNLSDLERVQLLREAEYYQLLELSGAELSYACLKNVLFSGADLSGAFFVGANLRSANLQDLQYADLQTADLTHANLVEANLEGANLEGANLKGAKLNNANLKNANLRNAHLEGTNLDGASLLGAIR